MHYKAPTADDVERLKKELGKDGSEMAELFGVAGNRAFRRYTSKSDDPKNKRELGMHMLFFAMARLVLPPEDIERVLARMRKAGATVDLSETTGED
jgi:hypothetical protein